MPADYFEALNAAGGEECVFNPSYGRRYLLRNHQKLALADDRSVLAGGFNVADDYFGTSASGAWRDLGQARSATRSPSRPEGRSVSTTISTMKAKMSE